MTISRSDAEMAASMRRPWRWIGYVLVILLALIAIRVWSAASFDNGPMPPALPQSGRLHVTLPDGRRAFLRDLVRPGLPTVITLWASWCGPCIQEAPKIAELRRRFSPEKLNIVYLNVRDIAATPQERAQYMANAKLPRDAYAVLDGDRIGALTNAPDILIPRTLIFDRAGKPLASITGYKPFALARVAGLVSQ